MRKKFTQRQLLTYTANMQTSLIGMEACSGAHSLGRALRKQGHDVRLMAAQFVKPFVNLLSELVSNTDRLIRTDMRATHHGQERCVLHKRPNTFAQTRLLALSSFLAVGRRTIHHRTVERGTANKRFAAFCSNDSRAFYVANPKPIKINNKHVRASGVLSEDLTILSAVISVWS